MKAPSKPLSSPRRADKFPPPLMRFLRSNVGSRSRGRSRSSPIFYLRSKKRPPVGVIETAHEPSSPKVTCIGQVRVRGGKNDGAAVNCRRRCRWLNRTLFCRNFHPRFSKKPLGKLLRRLGLTFRSDCCRELGAAEENNSRVYSDKKSGGNENYTVAGDGDDSMNHRNTISSDDGADDFYRSKKHEENGGKREFLESSSSSPPPLPPPKNDLLLTRCRSAPYRSSSLGGRFWAEKIITIINGNEEIEEKNKEAELMKLRCEENNRKLEKKIADLKVISNSKGIAAHHPLLLTRCKSEPARKGERLDIVFSKEGGWNS
ncbi:hypothetical protein OROGR_024132 [Orobanche gracilis]